MANDEVRAGNGAYNSADGNPKRSDAILCGYCGAFLEPRRRRGSPREHCSTEHRRLHWERENPRQRRMDFLPTASAVQHAAGKRETKAAAILARLRQGPATTWELAQVGGLRFGARILELRDAGHVIVTEHRPDHALYILADEVTGGMAFYKDVSVAVAADPEGEV